jgi:hypothetical protein
VLLTSSGLILDVLPSRGGSGGSWWLALVSFWTTWALADGRMRLRVQFAPGENPTPTSIDDGALGCRSPCLEASLWSPSPPMSVFDLLTSLALSFFRL